MALRSVVFMGSADEILATSVELEVVRVLVSPVDTVSECAFDIRVSEDHLEIVEGSVRANNPAQLAVLCESDRSTTLRILLLLHIGKRDFTARALQTDLFVPSLRIACEELELFVVKHGQIVVTAALECNVIGGSA